VRDIIGVTMLKGATHRKTVATANLVRRRVLREHNGVAPIREDGRDLIEVHVAGACLRFNDGRWQLLAGKRTHERSLYPDKWECGGGQVRKGEDFQGAIKRQIFEEFGLDVTPQYPIEAYAILVPGTVIPGVRFLCVAKDGTIRLNHREFSEWRWLDLPVPDLEWIPGLKETLDANLTVNMLQALPIPQRPPGASKQRPGFVDRAG
jgi:8-oxo-dGTP pyrophosphatase MutT (NUDIX family)